MKVTCPTLSRKTKVTFRAVRTENGFGLQIEKFPDIYPISKMDELEAEIKRIANGNGGRVYYGATLARTGARIDAGGFFDTTLESIIARTLLGKTDGQTVFAVSTYFAALLEKVGFATMNPTNHIDSYIYLTNRF
jgi:hypothetical protein